MGKRVRHKVFFSYHHHDQEAADLFCRKFNNVFILRSLGTGTMSANIINSRDTDYVMRRIRELYIRDSTVTIVLIGRCTWSRRYVDWELQASLRNGKTVRANGLLGIRLKKSYTTKYPPRLRSNLNSGYARVIDYPENQKMLADYIHDAYLARNKTALSNKIKNPRERYKRNRSCR